MNTTEFQKKRNGVTVECCVCRSKLNGSLQITSNFVRHLRNQHSEQYTEYEKLKESSSRIKNSSQDKFNELLLNFIATNMLPISVVESRSFKDFVSFASPDFKLISRQTAVKIVDNLYETMKQTLKNKIKDCKYVCTTADIWSTKHKSYLGYTCHWLDDSLKRHSFALACKRFSGAHTFDRIHDQITKIHAAFGLSASNVTATVTDNGSNFVKAFREFGVNTLPVIYNENEEFEEIENIDEMNAVEFPTDFFDSSLPKHIRCATHTLNLVASTDLNHILKQDDLLFEKHSVVSIKDNCRSNHVKI